MAIQIEKKPKYAKIPWIWIILVVVLVIFIYQYFLKPKTELAITPSVDVFKELGLGTEGLNSSDLDISGIINNPTFQMLVSHLESMPPIENKGKENPFE